MEAETKKLIPRIITFGDGGSGVGQSFNREDGTAGLSAVPGTGTPAKFTWPEGSRPTKLNINLIRCTEGESILWVVFDAPDAATAAQWLQESAGEAIDSQRYPVYVAQLLPASTLQTIGGAKEFSFTDDLSNMYYILDVADATAELIVEAS